jgi:hypothetical protein
MQTSVRLPMQSAVRRNLCQAGLTVTFCALSLSDLLFMEGDDVQPPSTTLITAFSGLGKARSTLLLGQRGGLSLATATSLDCYEGVRPTNMDEDLMGRAMVPTMWRQGC